MSLTSVHHQHHAHLSIQRALRGDRVPHAYLFHGLDGIGKERMARGLAELLLCSTPTEQPFTDKLASPITEKNMRVGCGRCDDCRGVRAETHPDLHLIFRQLNRQHPDPAVRKRSGLEISVDVIRHFVIDACGLTPIRGQAKLFIIREADRITTQAQNALLKTLEEPPNRTFIILLASSIDRLLPTTLSRCQLVRFDPLPIDFVRRVLADAKPELPPDHANWCAFIAQGSAGSAIEFADMNLFAVNDRIADSLTTLADSRPDVVSKLWQDEAKALADHFSTADPEISDTEATRRSLKTIFNLASTFYADVLRAISNLPDAITNAPRKKSIVALSQRFGASSAADSIRHLADAERQLDLNLNTQLVVDLLVNQLAATGVQPITAHAQNNR